MSILLTVILAMTITNTMQQQNRQSRIVGGYDCHISQYSYLAVIRRGLGGVTCGASIIRENFLLTAGHCCVQLREFKSYEIHAGLRHLGEVPGQTALIKKIILHKQFTVQPVVANDICIIELNGKITPSSNVKYVELCKLWKYEKHTNASRVTAMTMGFGQQGRVVGARSAPYNLHVQCVNLTLSWKSECQDVLESIGDTMFCAYDDTGEDKDSCYGDSGAPFMFNGLQIGIVSGGFGCGQPEFPSVYCRVDCFAKFIEETMRGDYVEGVVFAGSIGTTHFKLLTLVTIIYTLQYLTRDWY